MNYLPEILLATSMDYDESWYKDILVELKERDRHHRKQWEFAYVAHQIKTKVLESNNTDLKAIVFGAGKERIVSYAAGLGVNVLASDYVDNKTVNWGISNQLSRKKEDLYYDILLDKDTFDKNVTFENIDMRQINHLPQNTYDFVWSICSLEHVGSIDESIKFINNATNLLKPGGIAIHTTEFCIYKYSDVDLTRGGTVFFQYNDLSKIKGLDPENESNRFIISLGDFITIDRNPFRDYNHTYLQFAGFVATSIAFTIFKK